MRALHFLNVGPGDCTWIKHGDGRNTVVDVCNGRGKLVKQRTYMDDLLEAAYPARGLSGDFRQKQFPVNPIEYIQSFGERSIFRFILTHPDMDHMDGLAPFFGAFDPVNFWDTDNTKKMAEFDESRYDRGDWEFYRRLRTGTSPKRLALHTDASGPFYNQGEGGAEGGHGLHILAPSPAIVTAANQSEDFNDCSYVLLWMPGNKKVIIGGDSHDVSWEHILKTNRKWVQNVDLLLAPHHGRDSDRSYDFLDVLHPSLTFFGSAPSDHLGYQAWTNRSLEVMTNNQGNCFVVDFSNEDTAHVYCTNRTFAGTRPRSRIRFLRAGI